MQRSPSTPDNPSNFDDLVRLSGDQTIARLVAEANYERKNGLSGHKTLEEGDQAIALRIAEVKQEQEHALSGYKTLEQRMRSRRPSSPLPVRQ